MKKALICLNLYGCPTVRHKLKKGVKMHFSDFTPFMILHPINGLKSTWNIKSFVIVVNRKPSKHSTVQLDLSFARSIQKLFQLNHLCFGLGMSIIKTWEAKNSKFPDLLWRTRHLKSADFSTLKFQVLIVRFQIWLHLDIFS